MDTYDLAQVADLIGIYILDMLGCIIKLQKAGFYRDDRIIFIPDSNAPKTSKIQKIIKAFKLLGLWIEIASNLKIVEFLDVIYNCDNGSFKPFSKSNATPSYISIDSNHPRSISKSIPNAVHKRINRLSSCKKILRRAKGCMMKSSKRVDSKVNWVHKPKELRL